MAADQVGFAKPLHRGAYAYEAASERVARQIATEAQAACMLSATMDWLETFALLPVERPMIWLFLWPAPSLYAWAEGNGTKRVYWANLLIGWFPPFWLMVWWLAIFPPWLERNAAKLKRPKM